MDEPDLRLLNEKLAALKKHWQAGAGTCPLVAVDQPANHVKLLHYTAGPEAHYVVVNRHVPDARPIQPLEVTFDFAPFVEGTAMIYDLTAETMQGKARPFACYFHKNLVRIYAILPFQIEDASIKPTKGDRGQQLDIAFLDGRREVVRAALPLELRGPMLGGSQTTFLSTDTMGRCVQPLGTAISGPAAVKYVVRSLLTGLEYGGCTT